MGREVKKLRHGEIKDIGRMDFMDRMDRNGNLNNTSI
jgi:hypothetical protein